MRKELVYMQGNVIYFNSKTANHSLDIRGTSEERLKGLVIPWTKTLCTIGLKYHEDERCVMA